MEALSGRRLETTEGQIRRAIMQTEIIQDNIPDGQDVRVARLRAQLRGTTNMSTPYFATYVEDEDGDVAEITFDTDMRPLRDDPIYGVTYRRIDGQSNPKDGAVFSIEELVAKLFPMKTCVECEHDFDDNPGKPVCKTCEDWDVQASSDRHPANGNA